MGDVRLCPGLLPRLVGALDREESGWLTGTVLPDSTLVCSSIAKVSEQDVPPGTACAPTSMRIICNTSLVYTSQSGCQQQQHNLDVQAFHMHSCRMASALLAHMPFRTALQTQIKWHK